MRKYFTGTMPLLTSSHSFMTCGSPEAFTSTTILIYVVEDCCNFMFHFLLRRSRTLYVSFYGHVCLHCVIIVCCHFSVSQPMSELYRHVSCGTCFFL